MPQTRWDVDLVGVAGCSGGGGGGSTLGLAAADNAEHVRELGKMSGSVQDVGEVQKDREGQGDGVERDVGLKHVAVVAATSRLEALDMSLR